MGGSEVLELADLQHRVDAVGEDHVMFEFYRLSPAGA
jgi:hypothetical protein